MMHIETHKPLPWENSQTPPYTVPLAITGVLAISAACVALVALAIIGPLAVPVLPLFLPITATLLIGGSVCLAVAIKAVPFKPKEVCDFEDLMKKGDYYKAEAVIEKVPCGKEVRKVLYTQLANCLFTHCYSAHALSIITCEKIFSVEASEALLRQLILDHHKKYSAIDLHRLIRICKTDQVKNELRTTLGRCYLEKKQFHDACDILEYSSLKRDRKEFLEQWIDRIIDPSKQEELKKELTVFEKRELKSTLKTLYANWLICDADDKIIPAIFENAAEILIDAMTSTEIIEYVLAKDFKLEFKSRVLTKLADLYQQRSQMEFHTEMLKQAEFLGLE